ncbi:hypothetical protein IID24_02900 [Patescibacteria group bacterium]|nr:hypothetical protein [Patescibacteria group bacterium]
MGSRNSRIGWVGIGVFLFVIATAAFFYTTFRITEPAVVSVTLGDGYSRRAAAIEFGTQLGWTRAAETQFVETFGQTQWDAFADELVVLMSNEFSWDDAERELFLTQSVRFLEPDRDMLAHIYMPGTYLVARDSSSAQIAEMLVERVTREISALAAFVEERVDDDTRATVASFIQGQVELLPDLIPLPPQNIGLLAAGNRTLLIFDTTYYNIGRGPLELIADPKTAGIRKDIERTVFQRIYRIDGKYRERPAGTFLWEQQHLHYHFSDFVEYHLEPLFYTTLIDQAQLRKKSTFCIRDVSRFTGYDESSNNPAAYLNCSKETQGVSVGWGDTYFDTYVDQNIDITKISSGTYRLLFTVNPNDRYDEITKDNNRSSATIEIDKEKETIKILELEPSELPAFEHVYIEKVY